MRRILLVGFLAVLAAAVLWVLSEVEVSPVPTPPPPPAATSTTTPATGSDKSTHYTAPDFFLSIELPGEKWASDNSANPDASVWRNASQAIIFAVFPTGEKPAGSDDELSAHATRYAAAALSRYTVDSQAFHGLDAYRVEGIGTADEQGGALNGYHLIGYVYSLHDREYALFVGADVAHWDASHRSMIGMILDSVRFQ